LILEFKALEKLKTNNMTLKAIKNYTYKVKNGKTKNLLNTNLKFVEALLLYNY